MLNDENDENMIHLKWFNVFEMIGLHEMMCFELIGDHDCDENLNELIQLTKLCDI